MSKPAGSSDSASSGAEHPDADDHPERSARNARIGLWLFAAYVLLYAGFMGVNVWAPPLMARAPFGGVNLAILYGMGLIVAAIVLALIYMQLCRRRSPPVADDPGASA